MKKNRHRSKLTLAAQTVRALTTAQLAEPRGGCDTGSITTENTRTRQAPGG